MAPASVMPPLRFCCSRAWAARNTAGIQSPFGSRVVRHARAVCSALNGSPRRAACSSPALSRQRASPEYAMKTTGRTTPSARASE